MTAVTSFPYAVKCARANKVIRAMLSPRVIAVTVGIERKKNRELGPSTLMGQQPTSQLAK
jgi:hypothetical protein